jgi:hypothetical protein
MKLELPTLPFVSLLSFCSDFEQMASKETKKLLDGAEVEGSHRSFPLPDS